MQFNHFELLNGAGEQLPSKKKKQSKSKGKQAVNGNAAQTGAAATSTALKAGASAPLDAEESCSQLEEAAKACNRGGPERIKLWGSWMAQAGDMNSQTTYQGSDGSTLAFKQLFLHSRALELTVEGCLTAPMPPAQECGLRQLLTVFLPNVDAGVVTEAIAQLAALQTDEPSAYGCLFAAQRAVHDLISALKQAGLAAVSSSNEAAGKQAAWQAQLERINRELLQKGNALQSMLQNGGAASKQHLDAANHLVKLHADRLQLLEQLGGSSASKGASARERAVQSLGELRSMITASWQDMAAMQNGTNGQVSAGAAMDQEATKLLQQEARLNAEIQGLEHQLVMLKQEAARVSERRQQLLQRKSAKKKPAAGSGARPANQAAAYHQSQLQSLDKVCALLAASPGDGQEAGNAANADAAVQYLAAVRKLLAMQLGTLSDMPERIKFCKQRLEKAKKLHALNVPSSAQANGAGGMGKQVADASALLSESMAASEEARLKTDRLVESARRRITELGLVAQLQPVLRDIEGIQGEIHVCCKGAAAQAAG